MKKSVCVCSYNGEKYIEEQLNSIINQTKKVDEIILCDDNSSDNTVAVAKKVLELSEIEYKIFVNIPNKGVTKNFEFCCQQSTGEIIFFSDQDDVWMPDKVEKVCQIFEQNVDIQLVFSNAVLFDENDNFKDSCWKRFDFDKRYKLFKKNQFDCILKGWFVTGATMAVKRSLLVDCIPFNSKLLHDQILSFVASNYNTCYAINEKLIKYRQHSNQVVGAKKMSVNEQMNFKVDSNVEIEKLKILQKCINNQENIEKINDKCNFIKHRDELKNVNRFVRMFKCLTIFSQYKKFKTYPFKSYLKDVLL